MSLLKQNIVVDCMWGFLYHEAFQDSFDKRSYQNGDIKVLYMYINVHDDNSTKYNVRNLVSGLHL